MWWHKEKAPLISIAELAAHDRKIVRIVGVAESLGDEMETPYSNRKCLAVASQMELGAGTGDADDINGVDLVARFRVGDGSGYITVRPDRVRLEFDLQIVLAQPHHEARFGDSIIQRNLERRGGSLRSVITQEGVLLAGERVAVIGRVSHLDEWTLIGIEKEPVIISKHANQLTAG